MKYFYLPILMITTSVHAQNFLTDFKNVNQQVGQNEVDNYLKKPTKEGIPGSLFTSLLPARTEECDENGEPKKTHYEVILMTEISTQETKTEILPGQVAVFNTKDLQMLMTRIPESESAKGSSPEAIMARANEIWNSGWFKVPSPTFDPNSAMGKELFVESLVHASAQSTLSESELTRSIASTIARTYTTEEQKFNVLSALSLRLYRNYNTARNPGFDNKFNNPNDEDLPAADMSLNDMMKGAASYNSFKGGVCNDITETVAQVGELLFPDKDVLVVNSGTHFGVVVADEKENRIIDGGNEISLQNKLLLDPKMSPTNLRISKMDNGALRQIAVTDTEMGQLTEAAFQTGKHLLKTDADISSLMAHYKKKNFGVTAGTGHLSDSNVFIVVAKYETSGEKWKSHIGLGATAQSFKNGDPMKYQVHFRAGVERNIFRYVNSSTEINFATGLRANAMYTLNPQKTPGVQLVDMSMGLDAINRLDVNWGKQNPDGFQVRSSVEVEHTAGVKNWGNTQGALSYMEMKDVPTVLKNMNFHLNQVNADVTVEKKLKTNLTGFANTHYQGSNVGQNVSVLAGLNIKAPSGAQILVFTGYTNGEMRGYQTKHSLLATPTGAQMGAKYISPRGIEVGGAVRSISGKPSVQATVKIPLGKKK